MPQPATKNCPKCGGEKTMTIGYRESTKGDGSFTRVDVWRCEKCSNEEAR